MYDGKEWSVGVVRGASVSYIEGVGARWVCDSIGGGVMPIRPSKAQLCCWECVMCAKRVQGVVLEGLWSSQQEGNAVVGTLPVEGG